MDAWETTTARHPRGSNPLLFRLIRFCGGPVGGFVGTGSTPVSEKIFLKSVDNNRKL